MGRGGGQSCRPRRLGRRSRVGEGPRWSMAPHSWGRGPARPGRPRVDPTPPGPTRAGRAPANDRPPGPRPLLQRPRPPLRRLRHATAWIGCSPWRGSPRRVRAPFRLGRSRLGGSVRARFRSRRSGARGLRVWQPCAAPCRSAQRRSAQRLSASGLSAQRLSAQRLSAQRPSAQRPSASRLSAQHASAQHASD
jgi:hypothetical protein